MQQGGTIYQASIVVNETTQFLPPVHCFASALFYHLSSYQVGNTRCLPCKKEAVTYLLWAYFLKMENLDWFWTFIETIVFTVPLVSQNRPWGRYLQRRVSPKLYVKYAYIVRQCNGSINLTLLNPNGERKGLTVTIPDLRK